METLAAFLTGEILVPEEREKVARVSMYWRDVRSSDRVVTAVMSDADLQTTLTLV